MAFLIVYKAKCNTSVVWWMFNTNQKEHVMVSVIWSYIWCLGELIFTSNKVKTVQKDQKINIPVHQSVLPGIPVHTCVYFPAILWDSVIY
jgi:hypothetical protein